MDQKALLLRLMRKEFGNLQNVMRIRTVTVTAVDHALDLAVVAVGPGDVADDVADPIQCSWLASYCPAVGDIAYLATISGAPILLGPVEKETWHDFSLPSGYSAVAPYPVPGYRKDSQGRVWFRGAANVTASNAVGTKFTLPAGWRPLSGTQALAAAYSNGTAVSGQLRYDVGISGNVNTLLASPAATVLVMFEGLSFDTRG